MGLTIITSPKIFECKRPSKTCQRSSGKYLNEIKTERVKFEKKKMKDTKSKKVAMKSLKRKSKKKKVEADAAKYLKYYSKI